jgi:DNA-directed RNA polymerase beta subunit
VMNTRRFYSRVQPRLEPPDFIAHQLQSYERFLREGIPQAFAEVSPIRAPGREDLYLELVDPYLGEPRYDEWECRDRDLTYAAPLKATGRLYAEGKLRQEAELYLVDIPLMTPRGTFIINGTENVIVSELVRSPGLYITQDEPYLYRAHFLPEQGAWLEIELDVRKWTLKARLDRRATVPITTYLRALGLDTPDIIARYSVVVPVEGLDELFDRWKAVILAEAIPAGDEVWSVGEELTPQRVKVLNRLGRAQVRVAHPGHRPLLPGGKGGLAGRGYPPHLLQVSLGRTGAPFSGRGIHPAVLFPTGHLPPHPSGAVQDQPEARAQPGGDLPHP